MTPPNSYPIRSNPTRSKPKMDNPNPTRFKTDPIPICLNLTRIKPDPNITRTEYAKPEYHPKP